MAVADENAETDDWPCWACVYDGGRDRPVASWIVTINKPGLTVEVVDG